jgi:hypothetical protein
MSKLKELTIFSVVVVFRKKNGFAIDLKRWIVLTEHRSKSSSIYECCALILDIFKALPSKRRLYHSSTNSIRFEASSDTVSETEMIRHRRDKNYNGRKYEDAQQSKLLKVTCC